MPSRGKMNHSHPCWVKTGCAGDEKLNSGVACSQAWEGIVSCRRGRTCQEEAADAMRRRISPFLVEAAS